MQKYNVGQYPVRSILNWVRDGEIAIPEIQRPFVWAKVQVRDLVDSLYRGFPIGYVITWKNPDVRLKNGDRGSGKKILIDGQQRITAMRAAILGETVVNDEYAEEKIHISFNPTTEEFETLTPAIEKDSKWIPDISRVMKDETAMLDAVDLYCGVNEGADRKLVHGNIQKLININNSPVGCIELDANLDIDTVTTIFIRINSQGTVLSQADFAMSKIASYGDYGVNIRKFIDYFCHLAKQPQFYVHISQNDLEFAKTPFLQKITWLKEESDDLYDPGYNDLLRVAFTKEFERGKLGDLVALLSGRNFETREYEQVIQEEAYKRLEKGITDFTNETNFKRFLMIVRSAGFITSDLIGSQTALNFAYILYLKLKDQGVNPGEIESYVKRWFVMSMLTGRYSGSAESRVDYDIKSIAKEGVKDTLGLIEDTELSDIYWEKALVKSFDRSSLNNPYINIFFAAQVKDRDEGFLSSGITVENLISLRGDVHHIFPKNYLKKKFISKGDYNQVANFVYAQQEINIKIGDKSPKIYLADLIEQCNGGKLKYGNITDLGKLKDNLRKNCIPEQIFDMDLDNYLEFLDLRRVLMAEKVKKYYQSL